ncbi:hypothetical protein EXIGLDRAFT_625401, partial [Exidia glandulosa HHB12029]
MATRSSANENARFGFRSNPPARANLAGGVEVEDEPTTATTVDDPLEQERAEEAVSKIEAYLATKSKQRPVPKSYPFPKSTWESKKPPPSPCRACGGPHWDNDCKHWEDYLKLRKSQPVLFTDADRSADEDIMYSIAYFVRGNALSSAYLAPAPAMVYLLEKLPRSDVPELLEGEETDDEEEECDHGQSKAWDKNYVPQVEVVRHPEKPIESSKAKTVEQHEGLLDARETLAEAGMGPGFFESAPEVLFAAALNVDASLPPPVEKEYVVRQVRHTPPGMSSMGISVLSARGIVSTRDERIVTLRLDSGASISLIAEAYLNSLKHPPKVRTGMKVAIAQLTNKDPKIKGYVHLPIWIVAEDGTRLKFMAELYVVPEMTIEVLLGEDFHLNYELNVFRNVELGSRVQVGESGFIVHDPTVAGFIRRKQHKRDRANRQRRKRAHYDGALRAWKDTLIPAETTVRVPVAGDLQQGREWYVERYLIPQADDTFLTVPNTLLDLRTEDAGRAEPLSISRRSYLPVANPSKTPRILRAGTLIGYAKNPSDVLDKPKDDATLEAMTAQA